MNYDGLSGLVTLFYRDLVHSSIIDVDVDACNRASSTKEQLQCAVQCSSR